MAFDGGLKPAMHRQLRDNMVAITSLVVALSALGYNTWRNERTERNRNVRAAGIELLGEIGSLQQIIFYAHYAAGDAREAPRDGSSMVAGSADPGCGVNRVRRGCHNAGGALAKSRVATARSSAPRAARCVG